MNTQFNCYGNPILLRVDQIEYDDHSKQTEVLMFIHDGLIFEYPFIERDVDLAELDGLNFVCDVIPTRAVDFISGAVPATPEVSEAFFKWFRNPTEETVKRFSELYIKWVDSLY